MYLAMNKVVPLLKRQEGEADPRTGEGVTKPGDFTVDEKIHQVFLTEQGHENAERILASQGLIAEGASLYDPANITLMHHLYAALRANTCTTATSITWCRTAKSSSLMNSPAA
jgi:preprotein translocase subunit SecA